MSQRLLTLLAVGIASGIVPGIPPGLAPGLAIAASQTNSPASDARDTDGDGLSDFHETHKYKTNPRKADSDGDGVPDGDWLERREYQYTIRSVVQVMRPVTPAFLNDDYQDARVLDETESYVELEVIHYPFNSVQLRREGGPRRPLVAKIRREARGVATARPDIRLDPKAPG